MADDGAKTVWERLQVLTGGSNYQTQFGGRSTAPSPVTRADVALAIALGSRDPLAVVLAFAIAGATSRAVETVESLAQPRLLAHLKDDRKIWPTIAKHAEHRTRVLARHAFAALVSGRCQRIAAGARAAKMRPQTYAWAYYASVAWMQGLADVAGTDAEMALG